MILRDYLKALNELPPEALNMEVVYSIDDEGNEFKPVYFPPAVTGEDAVCLN